MPNFFKSFFSGKSETPESEKQKNDQKNFEIFKYDGLRAQRMGRPDYAIKCFTEALAIEEDFETMGYLSQLYIPMGETEKARELLEKMAVMEPHVTSTLLCNLPGSSRHSSHWPMSATSRKITKQWKRLPAKQSPSKKEMQSHTSCSEKPAKDRMTKS